MELKMSVKIVDKPKLADLSPQFRNAIKKALKYNHTLFILQNGMKFSFPKWLSLKDNLVKLSYAYMVANYYNCGQFKSNLTNDNLNIDEQLYVFTRKELNNSFVYVDIREKRYSLIFVGE